MEYLDFEAPLKELEAYLESFKSQSNNIAIGITHIDQNKEKSLSIYRDWLKQNQYSYPLFFIDARKTDHILLIVESLIASLEVNYNLTS